MKHFLFLLAASALIAVSCEKTNEDKENPDPTSFQVNLVKTGIVADTDGFNMLTDGGFEAFEGDSEWMSKSAWYLSSNITPAESAWSGKRTPHANLDFDGWEDFALQTFCPKKGNDYTYVVHYRGAWHGLNVYFGFRGASIHDICTNANPSEGNYNPVFAGKDNSAWEEYSYKCTNADDQTWDAFIGGFCWYGLWAEIDDLRVYPTSSPNLETFKPASSNVSAAAVSNVSYTEIKSAGKVIAWLEEDGSLSMALHNARLADNQCDIVYAGGSAFDAGALKVKTVVETDIKGVIPTAGISSSDTKFLHVYGYKAPASPTDENPEPSWTASSVALLCSEDGGASWTKAYDRSSEGNFVQAAFCRKGSYTYIYGTPAGDNARKLYVGRVKNESIADAKAYQYWDGGEWVSGGDESVAAPVLFGMVGPFSVVYNPDKYVYQIIYRNATCGQLVYRDAGLPEGEWSGEKPLPSSAACNYPQALKSEGASISFIATKAEN